MKLLRQDLVDCSVIYCKKKIDMNPIPNTPTPGTEGLPLAAHPPMSLDQFLRESGLSPATGWRYRRKGWLKTITIAGRHYITREAVVEFNARAAAGEFAGSVSNPYKRTRTASSINS
jgi:hypothetical protein